MTKSIKLKNSQDVVLIDIEVINYLSNDPYFKSVDILNNLRKHSSGCVVFQKTAKNENGGYTTRTIYLHKLIAEHFLIKEKTDEKDLVAAKNSNKLDCRIQNICWRSRSVASRLRKTNAKSGYTGVYKEGNKYRSIISVNRKSLHIGMYDTAEEAALAYNTKSKQLFGENGKLNIINTPARDDQEGKITDDDASRVRYTHNNNQTSF